MGWKQETRAAGMHARDGREIERPISGARRELPAWVEQQGKGAATRIRWGGLDPQGATPEGDDDVVQDFVRIAEGDAEDAPDRVERFVRHHGPLGLCRHGRLPGACLGEATPAVVRTRLADLVEHSVASARKLSDAEREKAVATVWLELGSARQAGDAEAVATLERLLVSLGAWSEISLDRRLEAAELELEPPARVCPPAREEAVGDWRRHARRFLVTLLLAAALHREEPGEPEGWSHLTGFPADAAATWRDQTAAAERRAVVAEEVRRWLRAGDVGLSFTWSDGPPAVQVAGRLATGALARQLAFACARVDGFAVCAYCGVAYVPSRAPRGGQRSCCGREACRRARSAYHSRRSR